MRMAFATPVSIIKIVAVIVSLFFVWAGIRYVSALVELPSYQQACGRARGLGNGNSAQPCYYETATAHLINGYDHLGRTVRQDATLTFANNHTRSMHIDANPDLTFHWLTDDQVNGPCQVEVWHGNVTAIFHDNHKINAYGSPELRADSFFGYVVFGLSIGTLCAWVTLSLMLQRAKQ